MTSNQSFVMEFDIALVKNETAILNFCIGLTNIKMIYQINKHFTLYSN